MRINPTWLSRTKCALCKGSGQAPDRLCNCVLRRAFRVCLDRYHLCADYSPDFRRFSRAAEYRADFVLVVKRALEVQHLEVFDLHFIKGLGYRWGGWLLGLDKGNFFHRCYEIEQLGGEALLESGIFPPDRYFDGMPRDIVPVLTVRTRESAGTAESRAGGQFYTPNWGGPVSLYAKPVKEGANLGPWPSRVRIPLREKARFAA